MNFLLEQAQKKIDGLGNSGCKLELLHGNPVSIKKTALSPGYVERLHRQRNKQQNFNCPLTGIRVPRVLGSDECSFTMEHLSMLNAIDFFERAGSDMIGMRIGILIDFIHWEIDNSAFTEMDGSLFYEKLLTVRAQLPADIWQRYYADYEKIFLSNLPGRLLVLTGNCHGDMTFSNVMFSMRENQIGLIDFLDSFINSPLVDIAKLLQDARFHWSSSRFPFPHDRGKIHIIDAWLRTRIEHEFRDEISTPQFWLIQMMNYFRIIPYLHLREEHEYIASILAQISVTKEAKR